MTAGCRPGWVTGDSIYGGDRRLPIWLEEQAIAYVLQLGTTGDRDTPRDPGLTVVEQHAALTASGRRPTRVKTW